MNNPSTWAIPNCTNLSSSDW